MASRIGFETSLGWYLDKIKSTPLLTAEQERQLARLIREHSDPIARQQMIEANLRLVVKIAKDYSNPGMTLSDLVAEGWPLFRVHGDGGTIDDEWLRRAVATGDERTMRQDPAFAFRLLADISARALSPGVNDPTTSIQALDQIELLLLQIGGRRLYPGVASDGAGAVRFRYPAPSWEDYLSLAIDETRHFGEGSVQVTRRLRALLVDLRESVPESRRPAIDTELELLDASASRAFAEHGDRLTASARDRQGLGAGDA